MLELNGEALEQLIASLVLLTLFLVLEGLETPVMLSAPMSHYLRVINLEYLNIALISINAFISSLDQVMNRFYCIEKDNSFERYT